MNKSRMKKLLALQEEKRWAALESLARSYIKADQKDGVAWKALTTALEYQNKDSLPAAQKAIRLLPNDPQAYFNYGTALKFHGKTPQSLVYFKRAIELKPDYAEAFNNLGNALQQTAEPMEALKAYWAGVKLAPQLVNIQLNMGNCYLAVGQHERAVRMYKMASEIAPDFIEAVNAMLFAKDLMPEQTVEKAQVDRKAWAARFADGLFEDRPHDNDPDPHRRLRIGYVSADFREHSAIRSCGSIFVHHDRDNFEVFAYNTTRRPEDAYTKMVQENVDHWQTITDMSDQDVSDLIRKDKIDIIVDLSGHSGGNRLLALARKPAPVQITGWGYATGTGMKAMDVLFADEVTVPKDERHLYTEQIRYLPCIDGPHWVEKFPDVSPLPALKDGILTFGSFNRLAKVTKDTLALWGRVLLAVPKSGFVMKAGEFSEEESRERMLKVFEDMGVDRERIILLGATGWYEHMEAYQQVDIALDTIPQGGGVTSLEALMMAVPCITLRWPTIPGRVSAAILTRMGIPDWVAETQDEYVSKAIEKAGDFSYLAALRQQMRQRFMSTVGDGAAYAKAVEWHYRSLWQRWCYTRGAKKSLDAEEMAA